MVVILDGVIITLWDNDHLLPFRVQRVPRQTGYGGDQSPLDIGIKPAVIKRNNVFRGIPPGIVSPTVEDAERKMAKLVWLVVN